MPAISRLGDLGSGHGCFPPRPNDQASSDVFVNDIAVHRQSDHWPSHCCGDTCHDSNLASGCPTVFANDLEIGRIGDPIACGSVIAQGSPTVFAGDGGDLFDI